MRASRAEDAWRWEDRGDGVWNLVFDRPGQTHNSLDRETLDELDERLTEIEREPRLQLVVLRSAKPKGFCAGADLKAIRDCATTVEADAFLRRGLAVFDHLERLPVATIAMIHGVCLGGGLELALACRHRLVLDHPDTKLGSPEVRLGLIPGWDAITALPRLIGLRPALDLLLSGEPVSAQKAVEIELADSALSALEWNDPRAGGLPTLCLSPPPSWPPADGAETLAEARRRIAETPGPFPDAQRRILDVVEVELTSGPEAAREATLAAFSELCASEPTRQALAAFFNRSASR